LNNIQHCFTGLLTIGKLLISPTKWRVSNSPQSSSYNKTLPTIYSSAIVTYLCTSKKIKQNYNRDLHCNAQGTVSHQSAAGGHVYCTKVSWYNTDFCTNEAADCTVAMLYAKPNSLHGSNQNLECFP